VKKTAAAILIPFDVVGRVDPRDRVLEERAHQYHLENTVKRLCAADMSGSATRAGDAPVPNRLISTDTTYIFYGMRWPRTNINKVDRP